MNETPITLKGFLLRNTESTREGIQNYLSTYYLNQIDDSKYKFLGNLNILGNPLMVANNIKNSFKELIDRPKEGFI